MVTLQDYNLNDRAVPHAITGSSNSSQFSPWHYTSKKCHRVKGKPSCVDIQVFGIPHKTLLMDRVRKTWSGQWTLPAVFQICDKHLSD